MRVLSDGQYVYDMLPIKGYNDQEERNCTTKVEEELEYRDLYWRYLNLDLVVKAIISK
jgi:hypothetical protein